MITRHDIPEEVKHVIDVAITFDVIDSYELYVLAVKHNKNWEDLVNDICEMAYSWIHSDKSKHEAVVEAAELYWKASV
jgi:hypothetical protein